MIETLISSKTRIKLLLKFFLNAKTTSYLRSLEGEFGESTNAIRLELNRLEEAGMLSSEMKGNKKLYTANAKHPLFNEVRNILIKHIGLDQIIEKVVNKLGDLERVYLVGNFSKGINSQIIDLIFVGNIDKAYLIQLIDRAEQLINRKVRYLSYSKDEFQNLSSDSLGTNPLLLWHKDGGLNHKEA